MTFLVKGRAESEWAQISCQNDIILKPLSPSNLVKIVEGGSLFHVFKYFASDLSLKWTLCRHGVILARCTSLSCSLFFIRKIVEVAFCSGRWREVEKKQEKNLYSTCGAGYCDARYYFLVPIVVYAIEDLRTEVVFGLGILNNCVYSYCY